MLCQHSLAECKNPKQVLVVGGGVAGMHAARNLAALGVPSLLVDTNAYLGGMVMRLDKVYPTDHCAFCPAWSTARECYDSPLVQVLLHTTLLDLTTDGGSIEAKLSRTLPAVDPTRCLFCGACKTHCPKHALIERDLGMTWDPSLPPSMRIDQTLCDSCGACVASCPVSAIALDRTREEETVPVADVIYATGFEEPKPDDPRCAPEFGAGSHPDILTAMAFEAWESESRGADTLRCPSDGRKVERIAFIQCAGARDKRYLPYCASVCCMHAMKQARWLKRRQPNLSITLFYTDLRAPGTGQERYMMAGRAEGIRLLRSRPGLVMAKEGGGIGVRFDEPETGKAIGESFDLVVVNGGLGQCRLPGAAKTMPKEEDMLRCGFCAEPVDIAGSVIEGTAAALLAFQRSSQGGVA